MRTVLHILLICLCLVSASNATKKLSVTAGYVNVEPYQYIHVNHEGFRHLTGLDINLFNLMFSHINLQVEYKEDTWQHVLNKVKSGEVDIVGSATKTAERERYAYFSKSYRKETDGIYMRHEDIKQYHFSSLERLFSSGAMRQLKIGVIKGQVYSDQRINHYLNSPRYPKNIIYSDDTATNVNHLIDGDIDMFIDDEIGTENFIWDNQLRPVIQRYPLHIDSIPVHVMFSKKTMSLDDVAAFNRSMKDLHKTGQFQQTIRKHLVPRMIAIMTETRWYHLAELLGVISFALSGMLLAKQSKL